MWDVLLWKASDLLLKMFVVEDVCCGVFIVECLLWDVSWVGFAVGGFRLPTVYSVADATTQHDTYLKASSKSFHYKPSTINNAGFLLKFLALEYKYSVGSSTHFVRTGLL